MKKSYLFSNLIRVLLISVCCSLTLTARGEYATDNITGKCPGFSVQQIESDPNQPCFEAIRSDLNEKDAAAVAYDAQLMRPSDSPQDQSGGEHVMTSLTPADNSISETYGNPYLTPAVQNNAPASDEGDSSAGTN